MTLSITQHRIKINSLMTLKIMALGIMTRKPNGIQKNDAQPTTLSIMILSINGTQHNDTQNKDILA